MVIMVNLMKVLSVLLFQILLIMSYPPLVSSLVDIILNGDEVDPGATPEASPLPLKKVH